MTAETWVRVTSCDNIPLREGRVVFLGGRELALFNLGDRFLAIDNRCPHQGGPLADGIVTGTSVVCPLHAWKVNAGTGCVERPAHATDRCVATYSTRVEEGIVLIELGGAGGVSSPAPADPPALGRAGAASSTAPADPPALGGAGAASSPAPADPPALGGAGAASSPAPADPPALRRMAAA